MVSGVGRGEHVTFVMVVGSIPGRTIRVPRHVPVFIAAKGEEKQSLRIGNFDSSPLLSSPFEAARSQFATCLTSHIYDESQIPSIILHTIIMSYSS